jgi:farnesyl diphosphate synthase
LAPSEDKNFLSALDAAAVKVDKELDNLLPNNGGRLHAAMRYAALSPGKKLRPFLVLESAGLFGEVNTQCLRVAAALECVHCYSLVHDDLPGMDNDDLRRGQPTTHRKFDVATAILAGDALLTLAFEILAHSATHNDPFIRTQLVLHLAKAAGEAGMVGGQMLDMEAESKNNSTLAEITTIQRGKTGALFEFACVAGAILNQVDQTPLRQYAEHMGHAFQIADDILDVESTPQNLGKATQKDKAKGKATFVDLMGLAAAKSKARELADQACTSLQSFGAKADMLRAAAQYVVNRQR